MFCAAPTVMAMLAGDLIGRQVFSMASTVMAVPAGDCSEIVLRTATLTLHCEENTRGG